jgi:hypothetical protein
MRFWILTAITLMLAGDVIADDYRVSVNTSTIRRIKISNDCPLPNGTFGNGNCHMELTIISEVVPGTEHGIVPFIYTSDLIVNGRVPANTVNPWLVPCEWPDVDPLCNLSRNLWRYVLYLDVGGTCGEDGACEECNDGTAVLLLQPQMNTFGQYDGSFSTKVYLADNDDGNGTDMESYPWGSRVMTGDVDVKLQRETVGGDAVPGDDAFCLIGHIPSNDIE